MNTKINEELRQESVGASTLRTKFNDTDTDSEVTINSKNFLVTDTPVQIKDNIDNNQPGYLSIPSKLPLGPTLGFAIQFIVLTAVGTTMYNSLTNTQAQMTEKLNRIESNMYTIQEAKFRIEMQDAKMEQIKKEVEGKDYKP